MRLKGEGTIHFLKTNLLSLILGLLFLGGIQLMLNTYRLSRLVSIGMDTVIILSIILMFMLLLISGVCIYLFQRNTGRMIYLSGILWFPYYYIGLQIFNHLLPITDRGDVPPPVVGLFMLAGMMIFPIYILSSLLLFNVMHQSAESNDAKPAT
ncbi:hypothetical protein [Salinicoccus luteus]|uniref:hypothetical protein n=1 Tax=Salinicoccus luteus TaxID=367840 RepID=UPI0004E263CD|nr:hypothetical protein [Salinicoccus luteus]